MIEVRKDIVEFYKPFFENEEAAQDYLNMCYSLENPLPLRIINYVHRLITIGDSAAVGRGGYGIQVTHFVICIESIFHLLDPDEDIEKVNRLGRLKYFFEEFTSPDDKKLLKKSFARSIADDRGADSKLDLEIIARIFSEVRNKYVHEGVYYQFSFSSDDKEEDVRSSMLNDINIKEYKKDKRERRIYEITGTYEEVKSVIIRSCLNFLDKQITIINQQK